MPYAKYGEHGELATHKHNLQEGETLGQDNQTYRDTSVNAEKDSDTHKLKN